MQKVLGLVALGFLVLLAMAITIPLVLAKTKHESKNEENEIVFEGHGGPKGFMNNCGEPDKDFAFEWTPEGIILDKAPTYFTFHYTAPYDFTGNGTACATLWIPNLPDPLIPEKCDEGSCDKVNKLFPNLCPVKKGDKIDIDNYKTVVGFNYPITPGTYILMIKVLNQDKKTIICVNGNVTIADPYYT